MTENENIVQEQTQVEETPEIQEEIIQQAKPVEDNKEKNLQALRQKAERAERERDDLLRRFQEMEAAKQQVPQEDYDINIGPDDIAEGKHLSKLTKKIKKLEDDNRQYQQRMDEVALETKIRTMYPDFDSVVSKSNLEALQTESPELAYAINSSNDLYSKAVSAYTMIKKLGIAVDNSFSEEKQRLAQNASKPRSIASVGPQQGDSPLSKANAFANGLTDELAKQLRKEMAEAMKNR